jgi:serpin B
MIRPSASALALALLSVAAACGDDPATDIPEVRSDVARDLAPAVSPEQLASLVEGNTAFATDLYRLVRGEPGNLFMSPHSISIALAMTYAGAAGSTATQMADALHFTLPEPELHAAFNALDLALASRAAQAQGDTIPFRLTTANALFGQLGWSFEAPFLDTLAESYGAGVRVLDFAADPDGARTTINDWVEDRTNDRIEDLLPEGSIQTSTRLVLANAIYFSAAWSNPFAVAETADRPFHLAGGATVMVPTLHQDAERGYGAGPGYRAAELPYDGEQLSMVVIVPDDLAAFEAALDGDRLAAIIDSITAHELELSLPKFRFDAPLGLAEHLAALGMVDAFTEAADFSRIDGARDLLIQDVLHEGFVAIDERGTEAAAATAVIIGDTSVPERATLAVDRPFVFLIRDRPTGAVLFLGRVVDPR